MGIALLRSFANVMRWTPTGKHATGGRTRYVGSDDKPIAVRPAAYIPVIEASSERSICPASSFTCPL